MLKLRIGFLNVSQGATAAVRDVASNVLKGLFPFVRLCLWSTEIAGPVTNAKGASSKAAGSLFMFHFAHSD